MFKIFFILSCFCVVFSTSEEVGFSNGDKSESEYLLKLMHSAQIPRSGLYQRANEKFRQKYGQSQIKISYVPKDNGQIIVSNETIFIDHELTPKFLRAFSESIKKLSITCNLPDVSRKETARLVNEHCTDTLEEFQAIKCNSETFGVMNKPFKKVTKVAFEGDWERHDEHPLGLNKLFPEMTVLNLTYTGHSSALYGRYYPKLVELNTFILPPYDFGRIIQKNQQLKKLRLEESEMGFLHFVSQNLTDLETLAFNIPSDLPNYQQPAIKFERVKELSVTDFHHRFRSGKFSFKNLKHFELLVKGNIRDEWINFIGDNKDLASLTITTGYFNDVTLTSLSKKFNGLIEAKINCDSALGVDSIADFLENNKQMKNISLNFERSTAAYFKDLVKKLDKQWKIEPIDMDFTILSATKVEPYIEPAAKIVDEDEEIVIEPVNEEEKAEKTIEDIKQTPDDSKPVVESTADNSKIPSSNDVQTAPPQSAAEHVVESTTNNSEIPSSNDVQSAPPQSAAEPVVESTANNSENPSSNDVQMAPLQSGAEDSENKEEGTQNKDEITETVIVETDGVENYVETDGADEADGDAQAADGAESNGITDNADSGSDLTKSSIVAVLAIVTFISLA